jgi:hypothetical protein
MVAVAEWNQAAAAPFVSFGVPIVHSHQQTPAICNNQLKE